MGQGRCDGAAEQLESFQVSQITGVLVTGKSQGNERSIDDPIDIFVEFFEPENNEQKRKKLERFFNDPCDSDAEEKKGPTMDFHQSAGIIRYSQIGEEFEKVHTGERRHQSEEICQSQVTPWFWLEAVLVIKIENPDQSRGDDSGYIDPGSHRNQKDTTTNLQNFKSWLDFYSGYNVEEIFFGGNCFKI